MALTTQPEVVSRAAPLAQPLSNGRGAVNALQIASTDLCRAYFTAIGQLQNVAPAAPLDEDGEARGARLTAMQAMVGQLAGDVVEKHREIEGLIDRLDNMPCSEPDELRRLHEAHAEHEEATEALRERVGRTEELAASVRGSLGALLDSLPGNNSSSSPSGQVRPGRNA